MIKLQKKTRKEIAFQAKLNSLLKRSDKLDKDGLRRTFNLVKNARNRITARLMDEALEGWDITHLPRIQNAMANVVSEFRNQYANELAQMQMQGFDLGKSFVDDLVGLQKSAQLGLSAMPEMSMEMLGIYQGFSADLITNISTNLLKNINTQITLGITGEKSPFEIIKNIGNLPNFKQATMKHPKYMREKGKPIEIAYRRAEVITRTEISRILNLTTAKRQEQVGEVFSEARKFWLQTSANPRPSHQAPARETDPYKGGTPIPINDFYIVSGIRVKAPHDPRLPAKEIIHCACRSITVMPELI